jgi:hypothetical protein
MTLGGATVLLIALALPHAASAQHGVSAPTPTPTATGSASTPTPTASTLHIDTGGLVCSNGVCDLGSGNVGTFLAIGLTSLGGSGTPYQYRVIAGSVPAGITVARSYGAQSTEISGTPTQVQTSTFTLQVQDTTGHSAQQAFTLTINPPLPLTIFPDPCCNPGTVGTSYSQGFAANGGVKPYTYTIVSGTLPPGLRLNSPPPVSISGTPTTAGTFTFTIRLSDKAGAQLSQQGTITIS